MRPRIKGRFATRNEVITNYNDTHTLIFHTLTLQTLINTHTQVRPRIKGRFATRDEVIAMKAEKQQQQQLDEDCVVPDFA